MPPYHPYRRSICRREATAVSELRSLLDQLAALDLSEADPAELSESELLNGMPLVHGGITKLTALLPRLVAVGERRQVHRTDGMVTMKAWLTGHLRMSGTEAAWFVRAGRRL